MINKHHTRDFSSNKPEHLVLVLHGYGADGENLIDLTDLFSSSIPNAVFIVPNAPFPYEYSPDIGRQWFSLLNRDESALLEGAEIARHILLSFIDEKLKEYNLSYKDLIFIGFSQGTMMALYTGLKLAEQCRAIVGFSGTIVSAEDTIMNCKSKPPVCMVHGNVDSVVPCTLGKFTAKLLSSNGFKAEYHEINGLSHSIDIDGIKHARAFLENL